MRGVVKILKVKSFKDKIPKANIAAIWYEPIPLGVGITIPIPPKVITKIPSMTVNSDMDSKQKKHTYVIAK